MRIALVASGGFDESGRERVIPSLLWLIERLARQHDVFVYVLRYHHAPRRYPLLGATIQDLGRPDGLRAQYAAVVSALQRDAPFDIVHGYWGMPAGLVAAAAGRRLGIPSVVTCDSGEFVSLPSVPYGLQTTWRHRTAVALATRLANAVTVCSNYQRALASAVGVRTRVIPIGVDTAHYSAGPALTSGPPYRLLHVASINPVKDHATLLHAVRRLRDDALPLHLDIVGEDTLNGAVQRLAASLQLDDCVTFHGFQPADRLADFYRSADLFVLPSQHEAAGVVLLEAAACGVPVVGSAVGYLSDWSPDKATSVAPGDHAALASAIEQLLNDPARRERQARAAQAWVLAHDADWTAATFDALYHELTGRPTQPL